MHAVTAVFLLLAGCDTMTGPEPGQSADGKAAVSLSIAGAGARTVLPALEPDLSDVKAWKLLGAKTDEAQTPLTELFTDPASQTLYLETGDWDFTLKGYNTSSLLILEGAIPNQTISLEGPNTLTFTVAPVLEGEGTVKITITLPPGHGITQVKVFKDNNELETITPSGDSAVYEKTGHEAGDYYYSFRLYKGGDLYGVVSELVQVRANLASEKEYTLTAADLNIRYVIVYHLDKEQPNPGYYRSTDVAPDLPALSRPGYNFSGWYTDDGLKEGPVTKLPAPGNGGDRDFYAEWEKITYGIIYELYDGSNHGDNPENYTVETPTFTLKDPTRDGAFRFGGWYDDALFKDPADTTITTGSTGERTFHAQWKKLHKVTFSPNGGSPAPEEQTVVEGDKAAKPADPIKALDLEDLPAAAGLYTGLTFGGWYNDPDCKINLWDFGSNTVDGPLNLYAKWTAEPVDVSQQTGDHILAQALSCIGNQPDDPTNYTIVLDGTYEMAGIRTGYNINKENAVITLVGKSPTTIKLSSNGSFFRISAGELVLDNNITLKGLSDNDMYLVLMYGSSVTLIMNDGAAIVDNHYTSTSPYGNVYIHGGSKFIMKGGIISNNSIRNTVGGSHGGGVYVESQGKFIMEGGKISNNSSTGYSNNGEGGGVKVNNYGIFEMKGGEISGNSSNGNGGGVFVTTNGTFIKTAGVIYGDDDNIAYKDNNTNGDPTDNTAKTGNTNGHAVYYYAGPSTKYYRNVTLEDNPGGNINTSDEKPASSGAGEKNNWTMQ
jgi:uncharacterized repeat protein (TIGR02543 family)